MRSVCMACVKGMQTASVFGAGVCGPADIIDGRAFQPMTSLEALDRAPKLSDVNNIVLHSLAGRILEVDKLHELVRGLPVELVVVVSEVAHQASHALCLHRRRGFDKQGEHGLNFCPCHLVADDFADAFVA